MRCTLFTGQTGKEGNLICYSYKIKRDITKNRRFLYHHLSRLPFSQRKTTAMDFIDSRQGHERLGVNVCNHPV